MHILLAPNAFKGSLSALQAARAMTAGLDYFREKVSYTLFPIADGGNDTMSLLTQGMQGKQFREKSSDALGRKIWGMYGWIEKKKKAIIGLSDVSGLHLIPEEERDLLHSNTYGVGQLIQAALNKGAKELLIALGGSATTDGGSGLLQALGLRYLDARGRLITSLPDGLLHLRTIDDRLLDKRLMQVKITVLCDVKNPLLGPAGAAKIYGPQKGGGKREIALLETLLQVWSNKIRELTGTDVSMLPYGGAAGGTAAGLTGFMPVKLVSGISYFLDALRFDHLLNMADCVFTGEGALDHQTLEGKGPFEVARRAKERRIPVIGFTGASPRETDRLLQYFEEIIALSSPGVNLETAMQQAGINLKSAVGEWIADHGY